MFVLHHYNEMRGLYWKHVWAEIILSNKAINFLMKLSGNTMLHRSTFDLLT